MIDQATELRRLVLRSLRENMAAVVPPPRLIVVTGGMAGVGVTTVAVNLAVALGEQGLRTVIVDADLCQAEVAALCGLESLPGLAEVLVARRDIHEVLQRGPAGIQVVPGPPSGLQTDDLARERLLRQLKSIGRHAEIVVLDVGGGANQQLLPLCAAADDLLLVTTPQDVALMETYARIKHTLHLRPEALQLVVNQVESVAQAEEVHARLSQSCQRFLAISLPLVGAIAYDDSIPAAAVEGMPIVLQQPSSGAAEGLHRLAVTLTLLARNSCGLPKGRSA